MKIKVYNQAAEAIKDLEVSSEVFDLKPNNELLHQAVVAARANQRQVLAHTKDRSEVSGGGKKPWKQKGTGRARAGSSRSPLWIGGGVVFGPTNNRNFKQKINQKMKAKALCMALSDKVSSQALLVLDTLALPERKTKNFAVILNGLEKKIWPTGRRNVLIVADGQADNLQYSGRNLAGVKIINLANLNLLDLLSHKNLITTEAAVKTISDRYAKKK